MERSRQLEKQLKEVKVERDVLQRDFQLYMKENKILKEQLESLRSSHTETDTQAVQMLNKIRNQHQQLAVMREKEYKAEVGELKAKIANLKQAKEEAENEVGVLKNNNAQLKSENKNLVSDKKDSKLTETKSNMKVTSLENKLSKLQKENIEKDNLLKSATSKVGEFEIKLKTLNQNERKLKQYEDKVKRLEAENKEKENLLKKEEASSKENKSSAAKYNIRVKVLEEQLNDVNQKYKDSEEIIEKLTRETTNHEMELQSISSQQITKLRTMEGKVKQLETENKSKQRELLQMSNENKETKSSSSKSNLRIKTLEEQVVRLKREVKDKDDFIQQKSQEIELNESALTSLTSQQKVKVKHLEEKVMKLQNEKHEKERELEEIIQQYSEAETVASKSNIRIQTLEQQVVKLKREVKVKDETIAKSTAEASSHIHEVKSVSTQQKTKLKTLEEKVKRLEHEMNEKEDELCQVSTKLAHVELESNSSASKFRVRIRTMEEKVERLKTENKSKEEELMKVDSELSESLSQLQSLKDKARRMEMENKLKENQLKEVRSLEHELSAKTVESSSHIQSIQRDKMKLEASNNRMQTELSDAMRKLSSLECDLAEVKYSLVQKERELNKLKGTESALKASKDSETASMQQELINLQSTVVKLKSENQVANRTKREQTSTIEQLRENIKEEQRRCRSLEESASLKSQNLNHVTHQQKLKLEEKEKTISNLNNKLSNCQEQLSSSREIFSNLENKYDVLQSQYNELKSSLVEYKGKYEMSQSSYIDLKRQKDSLSKECRQLNDKLQSLDVNHNMKSSKVDELEKTISVLKESCVMLEKQAEDLEIFNNQLIEKQNKLTIERDSALAKCSELELQHCGIEHKLTSRLTEIDQTSTDQITDLQIQLRNEMNKAHEVTEEYRDLERRYKMLELNAAGVQRKLNVEKEIQLRLKDESSRNKAASSYTQQTVTRLKQELNIELDRCDELEKEKTSLQNELDTIKLEHSHELVKLNCTGAQQIKLIDFLQSKIEELEPAEKKKKKLKKTTLYQAPLQYRELRDLLEEEKAANVRLQTQVNNMRSELQATNSKVKRMKHGMNTTAPLSPGSIAAISAIVKSPAATPTTSDQSQASKGSKLRSKPRMHHNIPHRLTSWICNRATRCSVCLAVLHFGHGSLKCNECGMVCHAHCRANVTNTCGLPGGLFQQFKDGTKTSNLSPITCVFKGSNADQLHGKLKVLCGNETWTPRFVRLCGGQVRIAPPNAKSPSKHTDNDDVIDLKQAAYVHTDVSNLELPNTAKQDIPYVFKIQTGSSNSCWPARSVYFMSAGYSEKHQWVGKLEAVTAEHNGTKNITSNTKIFGNEILTLLSDEKLEINCSLPISDKHILLGCDEGLFLLAPNKSSVSSRSNLKQVNEVSKIFQMTKLDKNKVVAIEGVTQRLVVLDITQIQTQKTSLQVIEEIQGCHLFAIGYAEGVHYICVASATNITLLRFNDKLKKFCVKKEIATSEPCTCMVFTACSVIIGTNKFYEVDLSDFRIDEFLDDPEVLPPEDAAIFPVSVLRISEDNNPEEFLLCYHEFGLFVDGFGRLTRSGQLNWSRMPLAFEYRSPYLAIIQFNSVEIIQIDHFATTAGSSALDHAFLAFPSARYLGQAITEGALYLSSCEGSRTSVFCCIGNMNKESKDGKKPTGALANKRRYAALSSSMDSLASPTVKRSVMTEVSNLRNTRELSSSSQSILETSRWTTSGSYDDDEQSVKGFGIGRNKTCTSEESILSDSTTTTVESRLFWNKPKPMSESTPPPKPTRKRRNQAQIPSTEV
uniref:citron Rho-interacting kinase isoform X1 n=1 Tax=Ciona intestinalis TaxID=7719 RepID=UPI00089DB27D|nr:citron Rho-interacting kinase isoform X1 [Ciona intestinalis]|eukprot:XP_018669288.1 citron Rho-interacting kinase isoform X1 [Ciona intestinalis]